LAATPFFLYHIVQIYQIIDGNQDISEGFPKTRQPAYYLTFKIFLCYFVLKSLKKWVKKMWMKKMEYKSRNIFLQPNILTGSFRNE